MATTYRAVVQCHDPRAQFMMLPSFSVVVARDSKAVRAKVCERLAGMLAHATPH